MGKRQKNEEYFASKIARDCLADIQFPIGKMKENEIRPYLEQREAGKRTQEDINEMILGAATMQAYLQTHEVFQFHPVLVEELAVQTELNFRMQDLHLPYDTFFMDIYDANLSVDGKIVHGTYIHNNPVDQVLAMIALVHTAKNSVIMLKAAMDYSSGKTIGELRADIEGGYDGENKLNHVVFALLAYLSSVEPDIKEKGMQNAIVTGNRGGKFVSKTRLWDVGSRYVKDYESKLGFVPGNEKNNEEKQEHGHASPRRHLRAAHWHTYRCGTGRKEIKVLWVAACWVGEDHDEAVDVVHVKE